MPNRIEDYALIGDCETAALVGRDGSIDWLCWPRFDSDACFAALLGTAEHGRWLLAACDDKARITRRYRGDTLILETRFETDTGTAVVIDFMPPRGQNSDVIRIVRGERGSVRMHTELVLRFGYGAAVPWVRRIAENTWSAIAGPEMVIVYTPASLHGENLKSVADFVVQAGESIPFVLVYSASYIEPPALPDVEAALTDTEQFWKEWIDKGHIDTRWPEAVTRSLITLKALTYSPTGGIVAAPTTSLPELPGGQRNWDYRFCWLRDATQTLLALMNAGYYDEAAAWRDWLLRAVAGSPQQMQIMYGVTGERRLTEWEAPWLPGYEGAQPVRIGNLAHAQLQLDVYGEVMDALHQARRGNLSKLDTAWPVQCLLLKHLAEAWQQPDHGIWEMRTDPKHFTYSKIMCWVAFDRAIQDAERYSLNGPVTEWKALREVIHREVCKRGFNTHLNCFVQTYGSEQLDASLLLIPQLGFLPAQDPRVLGTIKAVESRLLRNGLVYRYDTAATEDGLPAGEGAFLACSFWLADAYWMCGRHADAEALFERLLRLPNDLGLLAEEYEPVSRRMLGNFPQGFSHLSLINTAFNLSQDKKPAQQRAAQKNGTSSSAIAQR